MWCQRQPGDLFFLRDNGSAAAVFNGRTGSYLVVGGGKRGEAALLVKGNLEIFTWIIIIDELASFLLEFETYAYSLLISRSIFLCLTSHDFSFSDRFSSHRSVSFSGWLKDPCPLLLVVLGRDCIMQWICLGLLLDVKWQLTGSKWIKYVCYATCMSPTKWLERHMGNLDKGDGAHVQISSPLFL